MSESTRGNALAYVPGLDGLRAIAVLLVVAFHAKVPAFGGGFIGVDIFFVLSGYLISALLLVEIDRTGGVDFKGFWRRRLVRLFPAMVTMVAALLFIALLIGSAPDAALRHSLASLLYMADYDRSLTGESHNLEHMWSLAVEAKFYLVWPLILAVWARRMTPATLVRAVVLLAIAAISWRIFNVQIGLPWDAVYYRFDTRLSGLLIGSSVAAALRAGFRPTLPRWSGFAPLPLAPLLLRQFGDFSMLTWAPIAVEVAAAMLILVALQGKGRIAGALTIKPLVWLGTLSYGIYLWHFPIVRILRDEMHWSLTLLIGLSLSIVLAWLSLQTIERWASRYRAPRPIIPLTPTT